MKSKAFRSTPANATTANGQFDVIMNPPPIDVLWVLLAASLVFVMQAGFLCLEAGLTRTKNAIHVATKNIADFGLSLLIFWAVGYGIMFGATQAGWIGSGPWFVDVGRGDGWNATVFLFQAMFCGTAVTIVSGAVAERIRFTGYLGVAVVISLIYPVFGHWAWGPDGWLSSEGFVDFAGSNGGPRHGRLGGTGRVLGDWSAFGRL